MRRDFYCVDCVERKIGGSVKESSVEIFRAASRELSFSDQDVCPICGSANVRRLFGLETAYIKGYGFADTAGVKRDMDLHLMMQGQDPYKGHRQFGEDREVIRKLQKSRERNSQSKSIHI